MITGKELQVARTHLGITQAEAAELLGVSRTSIVNWEANGVPERSEVRVMRGLGESVRTARAQLESLGLSDGVHLEISIPRAINEVGPVTRRFARAVRIALAERNWKPAKLSDESGIPSELLESFLDETAGISVDHAATIGNLLGLDPFTFSASSVGADGNTSDHADDDFEVSYEDPAKSGLALAAKRGKRKADQPHAE